MGDFNPFPSDFNEDPFADMFAQQPYDSALFGEGQQPYQQGYGQQYESALPGGEQEYTQSVYGSPSAAQRGFAPEFFAPAPSQQQQQLYDQDDLLTYQTPVVRGEQISGKAPRKAAKNRVSKKSPKTASRKAPKKAFRQSTPDSEDEIIPVSYRSFRNTTKKTAKEPSVEEEDEQTVQIDPTISRKAPRKTIKAPSPGPSTDYNPITTLLPSSSAASTNPDKTYFTFLQAHLDFTILRFATVCVGLCRLDKADDADRLAQFAVDFFGSELWAIALEHYMKISEDGDEVELMKACMADCIGSFKEFYDGDVAQELQDAVVLSGLWYQRPLV